MRKPSVLIADDHTMVVEAFRKLLEPQYEIVATVADGRSLLEVAPKLRPDVIVIDIGMPLLNGLAAGQRLKQVVPRAKLIYVTMNEDADVASEALRGGASAYLLKSSAASELLKGIHEALRGGSYVTPQIKRAIMDSFVVVLSLSPAGKKVTAGKKDVLQIVAQRHMMKDIGEVVRLITGIVSNN